MIDYPNMPLVGIFPVLRMCIIYNTTFSFSFSFLNNSCSFLKYIFEQRSFTKTQLIRNAISVFLKVLHLLTRAIHMYCALYPEKLIIPAVLLNRGYFLHYLRWHMKKFKQKIRSIILYFHNNIFKNILINLSNPNWSNISALSLDLSYHQPTHVWLMQNQAPAGMFPAL